MEVYLRMNIQGKKKKVEYGWDERERLETERERDNKCKVITKVIEKYLYFPCTF